MRTIIEATINAMVDEGWISFTNDTRRIMTINTILDNIAETARTTCLICYHPIKTHYHMEGCANPNCECSNYERK